MGGEPPRPLASTVSIYVVVPDPDAHHATAKAAGATIVRQLEDMPYGSREYSARDCEGTFSPSAPMTPTPPDDNLKPSARAMRYGIAIAVVVVGILCGAIIPGTLGGTICTAIVGIGLVAVISLVFYDVGLTEDRDRAQRRRASEAPPPAAAVR